jgi:hypothetical protein
VVGNDPQRSPGEFDALHHGIPGRIATIAAVCPLESENVPSSAQAAVLDLRNGGNSLENVGDRGIRERSYSAGILTQAQRTEVADSGGSEVLAAAIGAT